MHELSVIASNRLRGKHPDCSELQSLLDTFVERGLPGITAAVATRRGLAWIGASGFADLSGGKRMLPNSILGIGSITKTFVATVILQLIEEGRLRLRDTPAAVLGETTHGIANVADATVAHLLSHSSGIPNWEFDPQWIRDGRGDRLDVTRVWRKRDTLQYIRGQAPLFSPGEKCAYSNTNYSLLGLMIEVVTGIEAERAIRERLLQPLALQDTYFEGFEPVPQDRLPQRYHWATSDFQRAAGVNAAFREVRPLLIDVSASNLSVEWTAGGMVATARDLVTYAIALRDGQVLNPESLELMMRWTPARADMDLGYGIFRTRCSDKRTQIGHDGGVLGFTSTVFWLEGVDAAIAMLCNVGPMHSSKVPATIGREEKTCIAEAALRLLA